MLLGPPLGLEVRGGVGEAGTRVALSQKSSWPHKAGLRAAVLPHLGLCHPAGASLLGNLPWWW